jgi:N-acetylglucosaminyldiphosphoundecaprenol N-acetyl-beta-D-mannosaminyltransferase
LTGPAAVPTQPTATEPWINVLGVRVAVLDMARALGLAQHRIAGRQGGYVCVRDVHGVMLCRRDAGLRAIHNRAALVVPDGMPLVWMGRLMGRREMGRVAGADLMAALCEVSVAYGWRHYLYGGPPGLAERLAAVLGQRFPGIRVVGADAEGDVEKIRAAAPDIVWVGIGTPRQERWMAALAPALLIGVGAAFDFLAGTKARAPGALRHIGLEWLHRLASEPRRLWRRYLLVVPGFVPLALLQLAGLRPPPVDDPEAGR